MSHLQEPNHREGRQSREARQRPEGHLRDRARPAAAGGVVRGERQTVGRGWQAGLTHWSSTLVPLLAFANRRRGEACARRVSYQPLGSHWDELLRTPVDRCGIERDRSLSCRSRGQLLKRLPASAGTFTGQRAQLLARSSALAARRAHLVCACRASANLYLFRPRDDNHEFDREQSEGPTEVVPAQFGRQDPGPAPFATAACPSGEG